MLKTLVSACVFAVLAITSTPAAHAQTFDHRTFFTFNQPITLPGVTLPAGTYQFRLANPTTDRRVVQISDEEGTRTYATLMSVPAERLDAPAVPEVRFLETPAGSPAAIRAWWYPGQATGYEFIYPRTQALALARGVTSSVAAPANTDDAERAR